MAIKNDETPDADEVMNAIGSQFQDTAQMIFNGDYIGFDSRLSNTGLPSLKNVFYDTFTSDTADTILGFDYDGADDLYKTPDMTGVTNFVVIEATDDSTSTWNGVNNTYLFKVSSGKWILASNSADVEVQRAEIIKTLFYGTTGADQLVDQFTNITSIRTSYSDDVGRRTVLANIVEATSSQTSTKTGTFADTSTNTDCSSWSSISNGASAGSTSRWELPSGNALNTVAGGGSNDELGTDTTGDEATNPADCQLDGTLGPAGGPVTIWAIIACKGTISWVTVGTPETDTDRDFVTDGTIPLFGAADTLSNEGGINDSTLIFKDTASSSVTNAIAVINSSIDGTSSEQISVSANGGSNWTDVDNAEIARPTAGTALWRRITITRADLSKEDEVTEQAVKSNFY